MIIFSRLRCNILFKTNTSLVKYVSKTKIKDTGVRLSVYHHTVRASTKIPAHELQKKKFFFEQRKVGKLRTLSALSELGMFQI